MQFLAGIAAVALILGILWDAFETIILPRRVRRRLRISLIVYRSTWQPYRLLAKRLRDDGLRETFLSIYGPLSLLGLLAVWAIGLIVGFALFHWALGPMFNTPDKHVGFGTLLYFSGTTFFTVGFGDVAPLGPWQRFAAVIEGGTGFAFLALIIGYLPVLYQAFSRREASVTLLDARAGSPPTASEFLRRHAEACNTGEITTELRDWERWAAELLESQLSYPSLSYFRSQHDNESWLAALTVVLDVCALILAGIDDIPKHQARLTFAMARHAAVDLCQVFSTPVDKRKIPNRLPPPELERLRTRLASVNMGMRDDEQAQKKLKELRLMYEPYIWTLADFLVSTMPAWCPSPEALDDWESSPAE